MRKEPSELSPNPGPPLLDCPVERLGEEIAELSARMQAANYCLLTLIRQFDERGGWNVGFASCAHWLNWRTGLALGAAREKVRVAHALGELPLLSESMSRGELSYSKVRALTRVATPENEEELLAFARCGSAAHVERLVRAWRRVDRLEDQEEERRRHASRSLETYFDDDGMLVVRGRLDAEAGAVVMRALEAASEALYESSEERVEIPAAQRRADGLQLLAESALAHELDRGTSGDRYQVVVHVDEKVLADSEADGASVLEDGQHVPAGTSQRLACDAGKVVVRHGRDGRLLDVGRKTRTIPPAIRRALNARDQICRFPGCQSKFCEAHHVKHWARGGETRLDNLVLLCRRHHRAVHEEGFSMKLTAEGVVSFYWPDGRPMPEAPSAPTLAGEPLELLLRLLERQGIKVDDSSGLPDWDGESFDLEWAVDALRLIN